MEGKHGRVIYLHEGKMQEMHKNRTDTVEIDCVEFMQLMKILCYMRQIRRIANDDA